MQRYDFYYGQLVRQADLDDAFDGAEQADRYLMIDTGAVGINSGLTVAEAAIPNLTVQVAAGPCYDQQGRRTNVPSSQIFDLSASMPVGGGNDRVASVCVRFDRTLSDVRTDDNDVSISYNQAEGFELFVVEGTEAASGTAVAPAKPADGLVLADVTLTQGDTTILDAAIDMTTDGRRDWAYELIASSPAQVKTGNLGGVGQALLDELNTHINGAANEHPATAITFAAAGNLASTEVQAAIEELDGEKAGLALDNSFTGANTFNSTSQFDGTVTIDANTTVTGSASLEGNVILEGGSFRKDDTAHGIASTNLYLNEASVQDSGSATDTVDLAIYFDTGAATGVLDVTWFVNSDNVHDSYLSGRFLIPYSKNASSTPAIPATVDAAVSFDTGSSAFVQGGAPTSADVTIVASTNTISLRLTHNSGPTTRNLVAMWRQLDLPLNASPA